MTPSLPFRVNLLDDFSVVTQDGEVLGNWDCPDDAIYQFTPTGAKRALFTNPFLGLFVGEIEAWWRANDPTADRIPPWRPRRSPR